MEKRKPGRPKNSQNKHATKRYTQEELDMALKMLWDDASQSVNGLAKQFNIPEATLRRYKRKGPDATIVEFGSNNKMLLTPAEEELLKGWILKSARNGFGFDKAAVLNFLTGFLHHDKEMEKQKKYPYNSERYSNERFNRPGIKVDCDHKKWYQNFMARPPDVRKRVPEHTSKARVAVI